MTSPLTTDRPTDRRDTRHMMREGRFVVYGDTHTARAASSSSGILLIIGELIRNITTHTLRNFRVYTYFWRRLLKQTNKKFINQKIQKYKIKMLGTAGLGWAGLEERARMYS